MRYTETIQPFNFCFEKSSYNNSYYFKITFLYIWLFNHAWYLFNLHIIENTFHNNNKETILYINLFFIFNFNFKYDKLKYNKIVNKLFGMNKKTLYNLTIDLFYLNVDLNNQIYNNLTLNLFNLDFDSNSTNMFFNSSLFGIKSNTINTHIKINEFFVTIFFIPFKLDLINKKISIEKPLYEKHDYGFLD